jgi:hypothetical protein
MICSLPVNLIFHFMAKINTREPDARGHNPGQEASIPRGISMIFSVLSIFLPAEEREEVKRILGQQWKESADSALKVADPLFSSDGQFDGESTNKLRDLGVVKTVHRPDAHGNK